MSKLKITVLKRTFQEDLAAAYGQPDATPCPYFTEGQTFITEHVERPEGFCPWAWNDVFSVFQTLRSGGDFGGWSKDAKSLIRCCTSGIRPVVFNLQWVED